MNLMLSENIKLHNSVYKDTHTHVYTQMCKTEIFYFIFFIFRNSTIIGL